MDLLFQMWRQILHSSPSFWSNQKMRNLIGTGSAPTPASLAAAIANGSSSVYSPLML